MPSGACQHFARSAQHFDFSLEATLFLEKGEFRGADHLGNLPTPAWDAAGDRDHIQGATAAILAAGAGPLILGGDASVPIPALAGYQGARPFAILQIDPHVDWGDGRQGDPLGYGSTMRRTATYPLGPHLVQVGIRGLGPGEAGQHDDARAWGSELVTSYGLHDEGVGGGARPGRAWLSRIAAGAWPDMCRRATAATRPARRWPPAWPQSPSDRCCPRDSGRRPA